MRFSVGIDRDEKDAARGESLNELALYLEGKFRIHRRIAARSDDRIEDRENLFGVFNLHIANFDHHKFRQEIGD